MYAHTVYINQLKSIRICNNENIYEAIKVGFKSSIKLTKPVSAEHKYKHLT